jgi:glycerophosphoryl diester phosphodiesterase
MPVSSFLRALLLSLLLGLPGLASAGDPLVIAHRGASGYLPEHTLPAATLAHAQGADFLELDLVMTRDGHLVVIHDLTLNTTTNVQEVFPERTGGGSKAWVMDFDLAEIRQLSAHERRGRSGDTAAFPERFPLSRQIFQVPTLEEMLDLVQGLNQTLQREVGVYIEVKGWEAHQSRGLNPVLKLMEVLDRYGYRESTDPVWIQSFDDVALQELRQAGSRLKRVQLLGENNWRMTSTDFDFLKTSEGLQAISGYADGIGPWINQVLTGRSSSGEAQATSLVEEAHSLGLAVHVYTLRQDRLPRYVDTFEELLELLLNQVRVDGVFTDHPDQVVRFLK